MDTQRTQVVIIGAGPAGLTLGRLLERQGIESVILEARDRAYCEARVRAGLLEQGTRDVLIGAGVGERLQREGIVHAGIQLQLDDERRRIPMQELTGRTVTIYGQTEVVSDLIAARVASGAPLVFEAGEARIDGLESDQPLVRYHDRGAEHELRPDFIAGCDGFHGVSRQSIPQSALQLWQRDYPFGWLGILAHVAPSSDELVYARNARGFALHTMRSHEVSRLYLQVDPRDDIAAWSDERIWDELQHRLALPGWELHEGPMLHIDPGADAYEDMLSRSQIRYVCNSRAAVTSLAENYVGLPFETPLGG